MMKRSDIAISLKNVSKTYRVSDIRSETLRDRLAQVVMGGSSRKIEALKNINLDIYKGEFFGIIGHNGSGKSTLINIMSKAIPPDKGGTVIRNGNYIRLSLGMGFNPELTARQNIMVNASILGLSMREIKSRTPEIIAFAELENFVDTQIKFFSKGMKARLAFAVAVHAQADILFMDEFFGGVGDERFKEKADTVFKEQLLKNRTIVHVSHSLKNIQEYCERVLVLDHGMPIALEEPAKAIEVYRNEVIKKKLQTRPNPQNT